jgi:hypothetical protein
MTTLHASPGQPPVAQFGTPDRYDLSGDDITVLYVPSGAGGQAGFTYKDHQRTLTFRGDEIRCVPFPDLGTVVSVTLTMSPDSGSTTFSVLLPQVTLPNQLGASVFVRTEGISTIHPSVPNPELNQGQGDIYTVSCLRGAASLLPSFR